MFATRGCRSRSCCIRLALLLPTLLADAGLMAAQTTSEYQVKAAFLYNFTKFIEWPPGAFASPSDPYALCVYGESPLEDNLKEIVKGKNLDGREFAVRRVTTAIVARSCQVLFVGAADEDRVPGLLAGLQGCSVLAVGELPEFTR